MPSAPIPMPQRPQRIIPATPTVEDIKIETGAKLEELKDSQVKRDSSPVHGSNPTPNHTNNNNNTINLDNNFNPQIVKIDLISDVIMSDTSQSVSPSSARRASVNNSQARKKQKLTNGSTSDGKTSRRATQLVLNQSFSLRCCFSHCDYVPKDVADCIEHIGIHKENRIKSSNDSNNSHNHNNGIKTSDNDSSDNEIEDDFSNSDDDELNNHTDSNNLSRLSCFYLWCPEFNKSFSNQSSYFSHLREQHDETRLRCLYCPNSYTQQHNRQAHVAAVHPGEAAWHCAACGYRSYEGTVIRKHLKNCSLTQIQEKANGGKVNEIQSQELKKEKQQKSATKEKEKTTKISSSPSMSQAQSQLSSSSRTSPIDPSVTPRPSLSALSVNIELRPLPSRPMLECFYEWCPQSLKGSFSDEVSCIAHLRVEHDHTRFRCKVCDLSYTRREAQGHHVLAKHPTRAYIFCTLCGQEYNGAKKLRIHECIFNNTATDAKPGLYGIPLISANRNAEKEENNSSASPTNNGSSNQATKQNSPSSSSSISSINNLAAFPLPDQCHFSYCGIPVSSSSDWLNHLESIHHCSASNYCCRLCPSIFNDRGALLIHLQDHEKEKEIEINPFWCKWCGQEKNELETLEQHETQCKVELNQTANKERQQQQSL